MTRAPLPALVALLGLAFVVRVSGLDAQSFWWDEAYTTLLAESGLRATFRELRAFDFHPPLHYVLTWAWLPIAGRSEFALRYLSVAAGLLTVAVAARLGRRLYGERGALAAAALFALAPFVVYYSQEARMYSLTLFLATLALYLLHRALEDRSWRLWGAYALACALGLYTFYYFVFVPVFGGLYLALDWRRYHRLIGRWLAASAGTALLYAPWVPVLLGRNAVWDSQWATTSSPLKTIGWSWAALALGLPDLALYDQVVPTAILAGLAAVLLVELARRRGPAARPYLFALLAFALPLALIVAIATVRPVFHPRYAVAAAPGLLLALAGALAGQPPRRRLGGVAPLAAAVAGVACVGYGLGSLWTNPAYARDDYRAAVAHLSARLQPADTIIYNADPGFRYYYRGAAPAGFFPGQPYEEERIADGLNALAQGKQRLWYVRHFEVPTDPEGFVERQLDTHARRLEEAWFGPLRVTLYALPPTPEFAGAAILPTRADFGGRLLLTGYALADPEVPAGGSGELTLRWQVLKPLDDLGVWVGLSDEASRAWGREDRQPRNRDFQLSSHWQPGDVVMTRHSVEPLVGTPPGTYRLEVGVYRLADLRGLDLIDAQGRPSGQSFVLSTAAVARPAEPPPIDADLSERPDARLAAGIDLAAYRLDAVRTGPGGRLRLTALWRAAAAPGKDFAVSLRLVSPEGAVLAEGEGVAGGQYPASRWAPGELVRDQLALPVPPSAPAGKAALEIGLSEPGAGGPATWLKLGEAEIDAVRRSFDVPPLENRVDLDLGGQIRLLGYRLEPAAASPGGVVRLTLYWTALADGDRAYRVFTHLLDSESKIRGQRDGEPRDWTHPTSAWVRGEVVEDRYEIEVQGDAPPGEYAVEVGMYDPATGERLKLATSSGEPLGDHVVLQKIVVR